MQYENDGTPFLGANARETHRLIARYEKGFASGSPHHLSAWRFQTHLSRNCVERLGPGVQMYVGSKTRFRSGIKISGRKSAAGGQGKRANSGDMCALGRTPVGLGDGE